MGKAPDTVKLLIAMAVMAGLMETWTCVRRGQTARLPRRLAMWTGVPVLVALLVWWLAPMQLPFAAQVLLTLATMTALGPLLYRIAYQPLAEASVLVLLIVSVALHLTMLGLGLWFFGAEGSRTPAFSSASFTISDVNVSVQACWSWARAWH